MSPARQRNERVGNTTMQAYFSFCTVFQFVWFLVGVVIVMLFCLPLGNVVFILFSADGSFLMDVQFHGGPQFGAGRARVVFQLLFISRDRLAGQNVD